MCRAWRQRRRILLDAEDEQRARQDPFETALDSAVETSLLAPFLIEGQHRPHLGIGGRPSIGTARDPRQNLARTGALLLGRGGFAAEERAARRRVANGGRPKGTGDGHGLDVRMTSPVEVVGGASQKRLQTHRIFECLVADEGHRHVMGSSRYLHLRPQPPLDLIARIGRLLEHRRQVGVTADRRAVDWISIDRHLNVTRILKTANDVQVGAIQLRLDVVLAVHREDMADTDATQRAERKAVDVLILREVLRDAIRLAARPKTRVANGQRADCRSRRQIALLQRRRDAKHVGHVVESKRRIVRRQHERRIDFDLQQIANGVGVFRPIETMQHRPARIRGLRRCAIEFALEPPGKRVERRRRGTRRAGRRHEACAKLPRDLFPCLDVRGGRGNRRGIQHEIAGLQASVVTGDAVLGDERLVRLSRRAGAGLWTNLRSLGVERCVGQRGPENDDTSSERSKNLHPAAVVKDNPSPTPQTRLVDHEKQGKPCQLPVCANDRAARIRQARSVPNVVSPAAV